MEQNHFAGIMNLLNKLKLMLTKSRQLICSFMQTYLEWELVKISTLQKATMEAMLKKLQ